MHLPFLVVYLMIIESNFAVNCCHFISFKNVTRKKSCLESFTAFSMKIFRWYLTLTPCILGQHALDSTDSESFMT